jgi:hypothetical protein
MHTHTITKKGIRYHQLLSIKEEAPKEVLSLLVKKLIYTTKETKLCYAIALNKVTKCNQIEESIEEEIPVEVKL